MRASTLSSEVGGEEGGADVDRSRHPLRKGGPPSNIAVVESQTCPKPGFCMFVSTTALKLSLKVICKHVLYLRGLRCWFESGAPCQNGRLPSRLVKLVSSRLNLISTQTTLYAMYDIASCQHDKHRRTVTRQ